MKKISVIIPTYNGEETIERCLLSVINQKGDFQLEILVCDDCSTDNTVEIATKYGCIILSNKVNSGGPNKGRNLGIRSATGDYIALLDQDDEWLKDKLSMQLSINADVVYSQYVGMEKREPSRWLYETLLAWDTRYGWAYIGSLLIKNKNVPLFEEYFGQLDFDWLLRLTKDRLCVQTDPVVIRNMTGKNLSRDANYRRRDFYMGLLLTEGNIKSMKRRFASRARYHYVMNEMKLSRFYFFRGNITWKTVLYYLTSYNYFISRWIVKKFKVSG